jgi:hypothetical protein
MATHILTPFKADLGHASPLAWVAAFAKRLLTALAAMPQDNCFLDSVGGL